MVRLTPQFGLAFVLTAAALVSPASSQNPRQPTSGAPAGSASTASAAKAPAHHKLSRRAKKQPEPEVVQPPPPPPTLEQMAPQQPKVSYQNGQLTIDSQNATLAQVLRSVQTQTGASIDIPGNANSERVNGQIGPGQPRDVLASLLNGSKFDYVILGVEDRPGAVQKVILTTRQNTSGTQVASAANQAPQPQEEMQSDDENYAPEPIEDNTAENQNNPQPQPMPPQPQGAFRPGMQQVAPNAADLPHPAEEQIQQQQQNGVKTPEQLLQELQRMQQQQQQYQQQLNPANQNPQDNQQPQ